MSDQPKNTEPSVQISPPQQDVINNLVNIEVFQKFIRKGMMSVQEYIWDDFDLMRPGVSKIMWVRTPIEKPVIEEKQNMLFHVDFMFTSPMELTIARSAVAQKFDKYWGLT